MELQELKNQLKERIALGLNYGLKAVEEVLQNGSVLFNELITYKSQYNDLNRISSQNLIRYEQIELGLNKIRNGLIEIIDKIEAKDVAEQEPLTKPKNNEVQFRKNNFFQLLDIHFNNLQNINHTLTFSSSSENVQKEERTGRDAIDYIYHQAFVYDIKHPYGAGIELAKDIIAYSKDFHRRRYSRLEVYMKMVKFILLYIMEEELEQDFFLGVFKSILSTSELQSIFYYAISGIDPEYPEVLIEANLFDSAFASQLVEEAHFEFLKK